MLNSQISKSNAQIQKLVKEQQTLVENLQILEGSSLETLMNTHKHLLHDDKLYGKQCHVSFEASKSLIMDIKNLIENDSLIIITSLNGSGTWRYDQIPETHKEQLKQKDSKVVFRRSAEYMEKLGVKDYNTSFFVMANENVVKVSIGFSNLIHKENYSSLSKGYKIPHLVRNPRYTENGRNGAEYFYNNCDHNSETDSYEVIYFTQDSKLSACINKVLETYLKETN